QLQRREMRRQQDDALAARHCLLQMLATLDARQPLDGCIAAPPAEGGLEHGAPDTAEMFAQYLLLFGCAALGKADTDIDAGHTAALAQCQSRQRAQPVTELHLHAPWQQC